MKALNIILLFVVVFGHYPLLAQKTLEINPTEPVPGQTITIRYNPASTPLNGIEKIEAYVYFLEGKLPLVKEIHLAKRDNRFTGTFKTHDSTKAFFIVFMKGELRDNNADSGYYSALYNDQAMPIQGSQLALSQGFGNYAAIIGLKKNPERSIKWLKAEMQSYASSKQQYRSEYLNLLSQSKEEKDKALLETLLEEEVASPQRSEASLSAAKFYFDIALKNKERGEEINSIIRENYPGGKWRRTEMIDAFYKEKDLQEKEEIYRSILEKFPELSAQDASLLDRVTISFVTALGEQNDYQRIKKYAGTVQNKAMLAKAYNAIAWKLAGEGLYGKPKDLQVGKELSWQSLQMMQAEINSKQFKPSYYTDKQWKENNELYYHMYADTYALLLYHLKDYKQAYQFEKKAVDHTRGKQVDMNEPYCIYLEKVKGSKAAQTALENFIRGGKYNTGMVSQLKRIYLGKNNTDAEWETYIAQLETASKEKLRLDISKKLINKSAPAFSLKNLDGDETSLVDLKGKIVVIDFWATWCAPCLASFPGMKSLVEKYKNDAEVKFVFIDTWENGADEQVTKAVVDFLKKTKYPFHVLMDYDNSVVEQYKVEGIPTKFVIDKNGQVRFKSIGFSGNLDAYTTELSLMIEMAKKL